MENSKNNTSDDEIGVRDPFYETDDPGVINEFALAELAEDKKESEAHYKKAAKRATELAKNKNAEKSDDESPSDKIADPFFSSEDPTVVQEAVEKELEAERLKEPETETIEEVGDNTSDLTEKPIEVLLDEKTAEQVRRLQEVYREGMSIRERYKEPGPARYRMMSVAAANLEAVDQPENSEQRVQANNEAIANAVTEAIGGEELDDYAADTLAAVQTYISELLIGDNADSISVGTTPAIVSGNGQIGADPNVYKRVVVVRWVKNGINHVLSFSPREAASLTVLVDDSVGDSWRRKFLRAGAVNDVERADLIRLNHDHHDEEDVDYHHEKSMEKLVDKILDREIELLKNDELLSSEKKAEILADLSNRYSKFAHLQRDRKTKDNNASGQ